MPTKKTDKQIVDNQKQQQITATLMDIFHRLHRRYGDQHWWPADTAFEIIIGAILTQSTSWKNVEKAMVNLKREHLLSCRALWRIEEKKLAELIRSSGYYNAKAKKVKAFVRFLHDRYQCRLHKMFAIPVSVLRQELLAVHGIGEETADSILLYAGNKPMFVIDAYTNRIFARLGIIKPKVKYQELQRWFMNHLPQDAKLFNEYHALLVAFGKSQCAKQPDCIGCLLKDICRHAE